YKISKEKTKRNNYNKNIYKRKHKKLEETIDEQNNISTATLIDYFQSFVKNHPDIVLVLSTDGKIISENEYKIKKLLGYRLKKKINILDHILQTDYDLLKTAFYQAVEGISSRNELTVYHAK